MQNKVWGKVALDFFRSLLKTSPELKRSIFSLGPSIETSESTWLVSLASVINGDPASGPAESVAFGFDFKEAGDSLSELSHDAVDDDFWIADGGILLFSIASLNPSDQRVAPLIPKVVNHDAVVVAPCRVVSCDSGAQRLEVALEGLDGQANADLCILSTASMDISDLASLRRWCCSNLQYSFRGALGRHDGEEYQVALRGILGARSKADDAHYVLGAISDVSALERLELGGFVTCAFRDEAKSEWALTEAGIAQLQVTQLLSAPQLVMCPRDSVSEQDMMTFELLCLNQRDGWTCHVKPPKKRRTPGAPVQVDFVKDGDRIWWLHHSSGVVFKEYLLALRRCHAGTVEGPIPHNASKAYYVALLEGRAYVPKRMRGEFDFHAPGELRPRRPPATRRRIAGRSVGVVTRNIG